VNAGTSDGASLFPWNINVKIPKKYRNVQWLGGTAGSVPRNEMYVFFIPNTATGMGIDSTYRMTYTDS